MKMKNAIFGLFCCLAIQVTSASMVTNHDFESGDTSLAAWELSSPKPDRRKIPAGGVTEKQVTAIWASENGNKSLLMTSQGDGSYALVSAKRVPLVRGCKYKLSVKYKAEGLMQESGDRSQYAAAILDFFIEAPGKGRIDNCRLITHTNSKGWSTLSRNTHHVDYFVVPDVAGCVGQVRLQMANKYPGNQAKIWWDEITIDPMDMELRNAGFEEGKTSPKNWQAVGAAKSVWVTTPVHAGRKAISVSDAPDGLFSGWMTEIPVRQDRQYAFGGLIKGGDLNPNGFIGGGALQIQFLDEFGAQIGEISTSPAVGAKTDWTEVKTNRVQPPRGALKARLIAGLKYCNGTAWFDDLSLETTKAQAKNVVMVTRQVPAPCPDVTYAQNLLQNGTMETGKEDQPAHWTYVGKSDKDWTPAEIKRFHAHGRPEFKIGRGKGTWTNTKYAGKKALLNHSIDPPLSPNHQWYGRNPVDGYWLSDPMPCEPGAAYLAGGWLNPGADIIGAWYGPLHLAYYGKNGRELPPGNNIRCSMNHIKAGEWTWWATQPLIAPEKAVSMRLKFAQELIGDKGGWGRTFADNLAVWKTPQGAKVKNIPSLNNRAYREWFIDAHESIKPPYLPSPAEIPEYISVWGRVQNIQAGNLFADPDSPATLRFKMFNLLGEKRRLKISVVRTDWLGDATKPIASDAFEVTGFSEQAIELELPATKTYGAFHLEVTVTEGLATVGHFSGRYAVAPSLDRPRTAENIWAVTPLSDINADGSQHDVELGKVLKTAGFGKSWIRIFFNCSPYDTEAVEKLLTKIKGEIQWYRALGIKPILQINPPRLPQTYPRQVDQKLYFKVGEIIGKEFDGLVEAIGNWGIEQSNSKSPYRGGGKLRITDQEYDTILANIYDGIKSMAPDLPVMIGNIATDFNADTIERLYKAPAKGRFEGAFFNAYMGQVMVAQNMIKAFNRHGNHDYTIWSEEQANQRSPFEGDARRYGEADGAKNMVRTWLSLAAKLHPRIKAVTMWGFAPDTAQDIMMMTPDLQPRPQYVAHAVMANALADAQFKENLSSNDITIFKWQRGDGPVFAAWANSGKRSFTLEVSEPRLSVMDLMGNTRQLKAVNGLVTLDVTSMPVYFFGGGAVKLSNRIVLKASNGTIKAGQPRLTVTVTNNSPTAVKGVLSVYGTGTKVERPFSLKAGANQSVQLPITTKLPDSRRSSFRIEARLDGGAVFASVAEFVFAQAVKVASSPRMDGTWHDWSSAKVIEFGKHGQIRRNGEIGEEYEGEGDVYGKMRLLWDRNCLYLGIEALDNAFVPNPKRGTSGFMGDSIEFGIQPNHILTERAPKYEFEVYLPADNTYAASQRFPLPSKIISHWNAKVTPTGTRGNANYQVAIPWKDLGLDSPEAGKSFAMSVVLNDKDKADIRFSGKRDLIFWFSGVHTTKNPEKYGDVVLVEP
jgi:hypothetical protein